MALRTAVQLLNPAPLLISQFPEPDIIYNRIPNAQKSLIFRTPFINIPGKTPEEIVKDDQPAEQGQERTCHGSAKDRT